jgi:hypothetical protein
LAHLMQHSVTRQTPSERTKPSSATANSQMPEKL